MMNKMIQAVTAVSIMIFTPDMLAAKSSKKNGAKSSSLDRVEALVGKGSSKWTDQFQEPKVPTGSSTGRDQTQVVSTALFERQDIINSIDSYLPNTEIQAHYQPNQSRGSVMDDIEAAMADFGYSFEDDMPVIARSNRESGPSTTMVHAPANPMPENSQLTQPNSTQVSQHSTGASIGAEKSETSGTGEVGTGQSSKSTAKEVAQLSTSQALGFEELGVDESVISEKRSAVVAEAKPDKSEKQEGKEVAAEEVEKESAEKGLAVVTEAKPDKSEKEEDKEVAEEEEKNNAGKGAAVAAEAKPDKSEKEESKEVAEEEVEKESAEKGSAVVAEAKPDKSEKEEGKEIAEEEEQNNAEKGAAVAAEAKPDKSEKEESKEVAEEAKSDKSKKKKNGEIVDDGSDKGTASVELEILVESEPNNETAPPDDVAEEPEPAPAEVAEEPEPAPVEVVEESEPIDYGDQISTIVEEILDQADPIVTVSSDDEQIGDLVLVIEGDDFEQGAQENSIESAPSVQVPEPASLLIMGSGAIISLLVRRRKSKK